MCWQDTHKAEKTIFLAAVKTVLPLLTQLLLYHSLAHGQDMETTNMTLPEVYDIHMYGQEQKTCSYVFIHTN